METLSFEKLENVIGGDFWEGFCTGVYIATIIQGGANPVTNSVAIGCLIYDLAN